MVKEKAGQVLLNTINVIIYFERYITLVPQSC